MSHKDDRMLTGAQALVESLERVGVDVAFGIPGGAILPAYDPLFDSSIRHILVRHEQGAGHAAEGYAMASGRVGVCIATSGPGATNLVTPIGNAYMDSTPLVAITGQVNSNSIGTDAFQEADIRGIVMPITKHSFLIKRTEDIPLAIREAFHIASTGRPGPVLVDIAKDALVNTAPFVWPDELDLPGYRPTTKPHIRQIRAAAKLISAAKRPVLYVGGGVMSARASKELAELVERTRIPVITTLMARGVFPDSHELNMGMPGMHGTVAAVGGLQKADLLIAVGTRFDDRVTGRLDTFAPHAKVIHADIDPAEIGKNKPVDVPIVGDAKETLRLLTDAMADVPAPEADAWRKQLAGMKERYQPRWDEAPDGRLSPQEVIQRIGQLSPDDTIYVAGVGQHQMWAAHFLPHEKPSKWLNSGGAGTQKPIVPAPPELSHFVGFSCGRKWLNSGGAGTMGFCVPAAMGAKVAEPDRMVWGIDGDGCFQMTNQELVTCALNDIPVKIAIINNNSLGMVRQWQTLFYNERYSNTDLQTESIPNFPMLAEAMGCVGLRATNEEEMEAAIKQALEINDRPVVVEFVVHKDAMVWPMVAAGTSNDEIKVARDMAPDWEEEIL